MPVVTIKIAGSLSREQRQKIAEEITATLEPTRINLRRIRTSRLKNCPAKTGPSRASCWTRTEA